MGPPHALAATSIPSLVALTVPLALFLLLAETAAGAYATVAFVHRRVALTPGFLKFMAVTSITFAALAVLTVIAAPPGSYRRLLNINPTSASGLLGAQALLLLAMLVHTRGVFGSRQDPRLTWGPGLVASVLTLVAITATLAPLAGSPLASAAIAISVLLSAVVLGTSVTGMLLGHWYLVTPTLTNRPLLVIISLLLAGLLCQAVVFPAALAGLAAASGSVTHAFGVSPGLTILWLLGAVILPLLAAGPALATCRMRSFMSTTGLLYLAMIAILPGQLVAQLLLFAAASA